MEKVNNNWKIVSIVLISIVASGIFMGAIKDTQYQKLAEDNVRLIEDLEYASSTKSLIKKERDRAYVKVNALRSAFCDLQGFEYDDIVGCRRFLEKISGI